MTKSTLNVHAGHDDYHCVDDTGFFQTFAKNAQAAADLNIISHRVAELALTPGIVAQDGFLTTHLIESMMVPERELIAEYLGQPDDIIDTPDPGPEDHLRRHPPTHPLLWDVDNPVMAGLVRTRTRTCRAWRAAAVLLRPHPGADRPGLRGVLRAHRASLRPGDDVRADDADYLIVGQGSMIPSAEAVADYLRESRGLKVGVVDMLMFRPFPATSSGDHPGQEGSRRSRATRPAAGRGPAADAGDPRHGEQVPRERQGPEDTRCIRSWTLYKSLKDAPALYSGSFGMGSRDLQPEGIVGAVENMLETAPRKKLFYLSIDFLRDEAITPEAGDVSADDSRAYPKVKELAVRGSENPNLMPKDSITVRFHSSGGWGAITTGKNLAMTLFDLLGLPHQGQPQVRLREEGPAHDLLPVGGAGADQDQLRVLLRGRGAVAGPERLRAHQRAGRPERRRRLHHPERQGIAGRDVEEHPAHVPEDHHRQEDPGLTTSTLSRSHGTRRPIPICSSGCRALRSRVRSSPPRR